MTADAMTWAEWASQMATDGTVMGIVVVVLSIVAIGSVLRFGIAGMCPTVWMLGIVWMLMANADTVAALLFDTDKKAQAELPLTVAKMRAEGCRLVEVDRSRRGTFDCHGVRYSFANNVTFAWVRAAEALAR